MNVAILGHTKIEEKTIGKNYKILGLADQNQILMEKEIRCYPNHEWSL